MRVPTNAIFRVLTTFQLFVGIAWSQNDTDTTSSCADRSDFAVIATISQVVSEVSLGLQECVLVDGTPITTAFSMTRFVWTVEPTDGDATIISSNAGEIVSAITETIIVDGDDDELGQNETALLQFLPGPNLEDAIGEVGLVIQIPRAQLVGLEFNFGDSSVILQLNDGFTNLQSLDVYVSSTQSAEHIQPGDGPTLKAAVTQSAAPLNLSLRGNAMDVQVETTSFASLVIESRNSYIQLKGDVLENDDNRIIGGNNDMCSDDCGKGLKVVVEGSIAGSIQVSNVNSFSADASPPDEPLVKLQVNDPTGSFNCQDTFFLSGSDDLGPAIQCSTTTDTVSVSPPFNCTTDPTASYQNVLSCPADPSTQQDETCECTVVAPSTGPSASPPFSTNAMSAARRQHSNAMHFGFFLLLGPMITILMSAVGH